MTRRRYVAHEASRQIDPTDLRGRCESPLAVAYGGAVQAAEGL